MNKPNYNPPDIQELKGTNQYLQTLKRDYESCQIPSWNDPMTLRTLDNIVHSIKLGHLSLSEFYQFAADNLGQGDFAWGCRQYVQRNV